MRSFRKTLTKSLKLAGVSSWKEAGFEVLDLIEVVEFFFFCYSKFRRFFFPAEHATVGEMSAELATVGYFFESTL